MGTKVVSSEVVEEGNEVLKSSHKKIVVKSSLNPRSLPFIVKDNRVSEKSKNFKIISEELKVSDEKFVSSQQKSSEVVPSWSKICAGKREVEVKSDKECKRTEKKKSIQIGVSKREVRWPADGRSHASVAPTHWSLPRIFLMLTD